MIAYTARRLAPAVLICTLFAAPAFSQTPLHTIERTGALTTLADGTSIVRCAAGDQSPAERAAADAAVARFMSEGGSSRRYMVPVAVHIVATAAGVGLVPFERVVAQIAVMNESYKGTPFEFYLFDVDTTFNDAWHSTSGGATELAMVNALSIRPTQVLNLYLRNPPGLLGYAYFPSTPGAQWASHNLYTTVPGGSAAPYNLGATATHEVGHNLGLNHTFTGGCGAGDGVADTTPEATEAFGCPQTRDTCPTDVGRDPIRNFMDYTDDACMFEFTPGQGVRAAAQIAAFKPDLGESGQPDDVQIDAILNPDAGPRPAGSFAPALVIRNLGSATLTGAQIAYEVRQGVSVVTSGTVPWAGSLAHQATTAITLPTLNLAPGAYRLHLASTLPAGVLDSQPQNDTLSVGFALVQPVAGLDVDWEAPEDAFAWARTNAIGYRRNWVIRENVIGPTGTPSRVAAVRHYDFRIPGVRFDLVTPPVVVPPVGRLELSFDFAYAPRTGRPQDFAILVSTDGGASFEMARAFTDSEIATLPPQATSFQPTAAGHWQRFTVSLTPFAPAAGEPDDEVLILFASSDADGNNRFMENVTLVVGDAVLVLEGTEGWRMLSGPTSGVTLDQFVGNLWTQGFPGSDAPGATASNVFRYDEPLPGEVDGYTAPASQAGAMGNGRGYLMYVYSDDNQDGTPEGFPKTLTSPGGAPAGPVALPTTYTPSPGTPLPHVDGWNLLGNPYPDPVSWSGVARTNVTPNVYVYDANFGGAGQFRVWNGLVGNLPGGLVPMGSAFFAKAHAASPSVSVPETARVPNGLPNVPVPSALTLHLEGMLGDETLSTEAFIAFDAAASNDFDLLDAYTFIPLSEDYLLMATRPASGPVRASIDIRPAPDAGSSTSYTIDVESVAAGLPAPATVTLTWPTLATLPSDLNLALLDNETSETVDLRAQSSYTFTTTAAGSAAPGGMPSILAAGGDGRLTLSIGRSTVGTADLPSATFALHAPAPNPFGTASLVSYTLDAPSRVRLSVFDVLGREVATLADGDRAAGSHAVALNAAGLRAGVYVVRLEAEVAGERRVASTAVVRR